MVRRKVRRLRGHRNQGYGKHHRGKGNRGGAGNAGRGKRSAHKKRMYEDTPLGKRGFTSHAVSAQNGINLWQVEEQVSKWLAQGLAEEKNGVIHVDLGKMGYTKLLGTGKISRKMHLTVASATKRAQEKIGAGVKKE